MALARKTEAKARMSIYVTDENRKRLASVPKGLKTTLINDALAQVLMTMEREENFDAFLKSVRAIKRVKAAKSSEELVRELRETGTIVSGT